MVAGHLFRQRQFDKQLFKLTGGNPTFEKRQVTEDIRQAIPVSLGSDTKNIDGRGHQSLAKGSRSRTLRLGATFPSTGAGLFYACEFDCRREKTAPRVADSRGKSDNLAASS